MMRSSNSRDSVSDISWPEITVEDRLNDEVREILTGFAQNDSGTFYSRAR
jgi:hypothetical protein